MVQQVVDACTLNNAINVTQLVILVALLRWVRLGNVQDSGLVRQRITRK
jgi:hypothetical protein